jgi:1-acyl-sn-glycerol-3-phosphate acyltransferase
MSGDATTSVESPKSSPAVSGADQAATTKIDPQTSGAFWEFCRMIARPLCVFLFDLKVYRRHHVPRTGGVLIVSNHQSYLDPVLVGVYLRRPMSYLAKSELFAGNRFFAWLIRRLRAFPVKQGAGDVGAVKEMVRRLKEGHVLNLYPEGSRTVTGEIGPIEPGAALVIRRAGVPVVPVAIDGSFEAWPKGQKRFRPYPIRVMYGPPLNIEGMKANEITAVIDRTLRRMLEELRGMRRGGS